MKKNVQMDMVGGEPILFQIDISEDEGRMLGGLNSSITNFGIDKLEKAISSMCRCIDSISRSFEDQLNKDRYSNIDIEFGLSVNTEGNLVIVNASAEANIKISVTLKGGS